MIESLSNPRLVEARRIGRRPGEWILVEGPRVVMEAVRAGVEVKNVFATAGALERHPELEELAGQVALTPVSEVALQSLADTEAPQGVVAVVANPAATLEELLAPAPSPVLVLTDVRDPGNVGTALRAAEGAGFAAAVVCAGSCDPANAKAVRASAGALFHLRHASHVLAEAALDALSPWRRIGAMAGGDIGLSELRVEGQVAVVVGNEAWGFSPGVRQRLDVTVGIPMRGKVASLNAGVAAALMAYAVTAP